MTTCRYCARQVDMCPLPEMCSRCLIEKLPELNHDHQLDRVSLVLKWMRCDEDGRAWMVSALQAAGYAVLPPGLVDDVREVRARQARAAGDLEAVRKRQGRGTVRDAEVATGDDNNDV